MAACGSASDTGEGKLPTATELAGYWTTEEEGQTLVWHFAKAAPPDSVELAGKTDVFHIWDYATDADHTQTQRGTYTYANGVLTYLVSWDPMYPCPPLADLCLTMVGKTYQHAVLGFTGQTLTLSSQKAASGRRVLKRASGCPAPKSSGRWVSGKTALSDMGYGEVGHTRIAVDPKQRVHVFTGTANTRPLRHAVRQACGWHTDTVDANAVNQSEVAFDKNGTLHAAYWQKDIGKSAYAIGNDGVYSSVDFEGWLAPMLTLADGTPHLVVTPSDGKIRHGTLVAAAWQWTEIPALAGAIAVSPPVAHADGRVELLGRTGDGWQLASRGKGGTWTIQAQALACDVVWRLQPNAKGGLRGLCGKTVVNSGGFVAKFWDTYYAERDAGPWKLTWLGPAMRGDLAIDAQDKPHVALMWPSDGQGSKPGAIVYGNTNEGDWLFEQVTGVGGLLWEWEDLRLAVDAAGKAHIHGGASMYSTNAVVASPAKGTLRLEPDTGFAGTVTSLPKGIQCPGACSLAVPTHTEVRLFVDFKSAHAMQGCRPRAPGDALHFECRILVGDKDAAHILSAKPAPVAWAALYGGPGDEAWHDLSLQADGDSAAVGTAGEAAVFGQALGNSEAGQLFVAGLGNTGQVRWATALPVKPKVGESASVAATAGGAVAGFSAGAAWTAPGLSALAEGAALVGLDAGGKLKWARNVVPGGGGTVSAVRAASDGGSWVAGQFGPTADLGKGALTASGPTDVYVGRIDPSGATQWAIAAGTTGSDGRPLLETTAEGGAVVVFLGTGMATVAGQAVAEEVPPSGALAFGLDAKGAVLWSASIGNMALHGLRAMRAVPGGFVASTAAGLNFVHRFDTAGKILWTFQAQTKQALVDMAVLGNGSLGFCAKYSGGMSGATVAQMLAIDLATGKDISFLAAGEMPACSFLRPLSGKDLLLAGSTKGDVGFGALVLPGVGASDLWMARLVGK